VLGAIGGFDLNKRSRISLFPSVCAFLFYTESAIFFGVGEDSEGRAREDKMPQTRILYMTDVHTSTTLTMTGVSNWGDTVALHVEQVIRTHEYRT
jgi:hypothetical protein